MEDEAPIIPETYQRRFYLYGSKVGGARFDPLFSAVVALQALREGLTPTAHGGAPERRRPARTPHRRLPGKSSPCSASSSAGRSAPLVILLIISAITFVLFYVAPRDPARAACGKVCTPETLALVTAQPGDRRPAVRCSTGTGSSGVFAGRDYAGLGHCPAPCLGYSFTNHEPVLGTILDRFPTTLSLSLGSAVVFVVFGVGTGHDRGAQAGQGAGQDRQSSASLVGSSLQIYFVGVVAMYYLADQ